MTSRFYKNVNSHMFDQPTLSSHVSHFHTNSTNKIAFLFTGQTTQSVLQKFRKTFSLHFQSKKGSKEGCITDASENLSEAVCEPSEDELSPRHHASASSSTGNLDDQKEEPHNTSEQKYK